MERQGARTFSSRPVHSSRAGGVHWDISLKLPGGQHRIAPTLTALRPVTFRLLRTDFPKHDVSRIPLRFSLSHMSIQRGAATGRALEEQRHEPPSVNHLRDSGCKLCQTSISIVRVHVQRPEESCSYSLNHQATLFTTVSVAVLAFEGSLPQPTTDSGCRRAVRDLGYFTVVLSIITAAIAFLFLDRLNGLSAPSTEGVAHVDENPPERRLATTSYWIMKFYRLSHPVSPIWWDFLSDLLRVVLFTAVLASMSLVAQLALCAWVCEKHDPGIIGGAVLVLLLCLVPFLFALF